MKQILTVEIDISDLLDTIISEISAAFNNSFNSMKNEDELITRKQALELLQVSSPTLLKLTRQGYFNPIRLGNSLRFSKNEILSYVNIPNEADDLPFKV